MTMRFVSWFVGMIWGLIFVALCCCWSAGDQVAMWKNCCWLIVVSAVSIVVWTVDGNVSNGVDR